MINSCQSLYEKSEFPVTEQGKRMLVGVLHIYWVVCSVPWGNKGKMTSLRWKITNQSKLEQRIKGWECELRPD